MHKLILSERIRDMCEAAKKAEESNDPNSKASKRYWGFVFLHATTIMHELAHVFVTYLSRDGTDTPPELNAGGIIDAMGESGAYLEQLVFGGVVVHTRDPKDVAGQVCPCMPLWSKDFTHTLMHAPGRCTPPTD